MSVTSSSSNTQYNLNLTTQGTGAPAPAVDKKVTGDLAYRALLGPAGALSPDGSQKMQQPSLRQEQMDPAKTQSFFSKAGSILKEGLKVAGWSAVKVGAGSAMFVGAVICHGAVGAANLVSKKGTEGASQANQSTAAPQKQETKQNRIEKARSEIADAERDISNLEAQKSSLQKQLPKMNAEIKTHIQKEIDEIPQALAAANMKIEQAKARVIQLQQQDEVAPQPPTTKPTAEATPKSQFGSFSEDMSWIGKIFKSVVSDASSGKVLNSYDTHLASRRGQSQVTENKTPATEKTRNASVASQPQPKATISASGPSGVSAAAPGKRTLDILFHNKEIPSYLDKPTLNGFKPTLLAQEPNLTAVQYGNKRVEVKNIGNGGNICLQPTATQVNGAIVNAANKELKAGTGVCGDIYNAGKKEVFEECAQFLTDQKMQNREVPPGSAMITHGGEMTACVVHAVGPSLQPGIPPTDKEKNELYRAYYNSLTLASENKLTSIALPAISIGRFGFPVPQAAAIATRAIRDFAVEHQNSSLETITLAVWDGPFKAYNPAFSELAKADGVQI